MKSSSRFDRINELGRDYWYWQILSHVCPLNTTWQLFNNIPSILERVQIWRVSWMMFIPYWPHSPPRRKANTSYSISDGLGVIIDGKLAFSEHTSAACKRASSRAGVGRCATVLSSYWSGLNSKYIKLLSSSTSHTKHTACLSGTFVGSRIKDKFERINERGPEGSFKYNRLAKHQIGTCI